MLRLNEGLKVHKSISGFQDIDWVVPKTLHVIMGQFDIEKFLEEGRTRMGQMEWIYILLSIFIIFGTNIVLMNAFIGLAVGDVEEVKLVFKNFENLRVLSKAGVVILLFQVKEFLRVKREFLASRL